MTTEPFLETPSSPASLRAPNGRVPAGTRGPTTARRSPFRPSDQELVQAEQARASRLCQLALEQTPEPYRSFIVLVEQSRDPGDRQHPVYVRIRLPYMTVDGRIKMAVDEHKRVDKKLHITSKPHHGSAAFVSGPRIATARGLLANGSDKMLKV